MNSEFERGSDRIPAVIVTVALLAGVLTCAGAVIAAQGGETGEQTAPVKVVESKVTVTARVQCKKYEKKVLYCTVDPSEAVARTLDMRLLLGYTAVDIDGSVYPVHPIPGSEVKFIPEDEEGRTDVSGTREIGLSVVYVE
jgi:hypothetical protein